MAYYTDSNYRAVEAFESFFSFLEDDAIYNGITLENVSKVDRNKMKPSDFAVPHLKKYPINDTESVRNGIKYFRFVPTDLRDECAKNLIKAAKHFKLEIEVTKDNPFLKYFPDAKIIERKNSKRPRKYDKRYV